MEENEAFDPASISKFCLMTIVFEASNGTKCLRLGREVSLTAWLKNHSFREVVWRRA